MVTRRRFFAELAGGLVAQVRQAAVDCALPRNLPETPPPSTPRPWLRPPGALPEADFLDKCTRCTDCLTACPHQSIRRLGPEWGAVEGTPAVIPEETPCYLCEGLPCIPACTSGALLPVAPSEVRMGTALLNRDACYLASGQPCDYCVHRCPLRGVAIRWGTDGLPVIDPQACSGCGVCAYLCPGHALAIQPGPATTPQLVSG